MHCSNRREWLRKTDVSGAFYWFRDRKEYRAGVPRLAGYVLRFSTSSSTHTTADEAQTPESPTTAQLPKVVCTVFPVDSVAAVDSREPQDEHASQESTGETASDHTTEPQMLSKHTVAELLRHQAASTTHELHGSWKSDAAAFALPFDSPEHRQNLHAALALAPADFPTKFAHFVVSSAALLVPPERTVLTLTIRRTHLLADSVEALSMIPYAHIHASLRVCFAGERGVDAGGIYREWSVLFGRSLVVAGVFRCVDSSEHTYYLNATAAHDIGVDHLLYAYAAGRLVGRSLLDGHTLGFHVALPLLKLMLGQPVSFHDLEYFDAHAYDGMLYLLANDNVESLALTFTVMEQRDDGLVEVELVANGRDVLVTDANKEWYLQRRFQYLLFESVASQLHAFLTGLYEVAPPTLLALFDPEELEYVLCGSDEIDVDDWRAHTRYRGELSVRDDVVEWFWELVREMPDEHRRRLLHFATGSSRPPIAGFRALTSIDGRLVRFTLKGLPLSVSEYVASHACFNQLDLPLYATRSQFAEALYATLETDVHGGGFTTD